MSDIKSLLAIIEQLRDPLTGCPWDLKQTMESIVPHTIEEAYELGNAIELQQWDDIKKECGDLLFQIIFYAQLAKEQGWFNFEGICKALEDKLINRHPHVFAGEKVADDKAQSMLWEQIKHQERKGYAALDDIPRNLPSLSRAQKIQKRVATLGFDWESIHDVIAKIEEEVAEVKEALEVSKDKAPAECGDLLFACTNLARWLDQDAEQLLRLACDKFEARFAQVEERVHTNDKSWKDFNLDELENLWQDVKEKENR